MSVLETHRSNYISVNNSTLKTLLAATKANTTKFCIEGKLVGKIVDVYDGDSYRLAVSMAHIFKEGGLPEPTQIELSEPIRYLTVRLLGCDTPEVRGSHRPFGLEVRDAIRALILNRVVVAEIPANMHDVYGRTLAHLYVCESKSCHIEEEEEEFQRKVSVRGHTISIPHTVDCVCVDSSDLAHHKYSCSTSDLISVAPWLIQNFCAKIYDGVGARPGYTVQEIADGLNF
jgi:endonuclease YncB( thermonuclease family)